MGRIWVELAFSLVLLGLVTWIMLTFQGCNSSNTGHRSNSDQRIFFVEGVKVTLRGEYTAQEEAWVREAIAFQFVEWRRLRRVALPLELAQIFVYQRRRGRTNGPPRFEPPFQDHRANGTIWHREDGGVMSNGEIHVFAGSKFEAPLVFHLLHHVWLAGPTAATDYGHADGRWAAVDADANHVIGLLRSGRP